MEQREGQDPAPIVREAHEPAASAARFRAFFELSSQGIWRADLVPPLPVAAPEDEQVAAFYHCCVLAECNAAMAAMYGVSRDELPGARLADVLPQDDPHNFVYLRAFVRSGYHLVGAESHEIDRNGNPKWFLNDLIGVVESGHLVGAWGTQLDITEQKRLEEELRKRAEELADVDRRKDLFLAMLAHELRNPLAPIRNAVELLRRTPGLDPELAGSRDMIERQVHHLARLVDDLLDLSRINRGSIRLRREPLDLNDVVERAVLAARPFVESRGHALTLAAAPAPLPLDADPTRLEQIVVNLLHNAAKYTPPGGKIWVAVEPAGPAARLTVRDTGIGIRAEALDRIFEPFVQSDRSLARTDGGLGIGLALVKSLVELHGGTVAAASGGLGQGSELVVHLPLAPTTLGQEPASSPVAEERATAGDAPPGGSRGLRILVVEDNLDAAESLQTLLELWDHQVAVVHDGLAAVAAAQAQRPEVVLLDIGLPGLDGYQVARRLRDDETLAGTLLVAMTGYGQPEDRRRSQEAGIHHHFVKPVEPAMLRGVLSGFAEAKCR